MTANIEIKPVAWSGNGEVLKYQGFASYGRHRILGEPKETKELAEKDLMDEIAEWTLTVNGINRNLGML